MKKRVNSRPGRTLPAHLALAQPFDRLDTTLAYARRLVDDTGIARVILNANPTSYAALLGMRFGVFTDDEVQPGDSVVCRVVPASEMRLPNVGEPVPANTICVSDD